MNKTELIEKVATQTGVGKKEVTKSLDGIMAAITDALAAGEKVQLIGFGNFETRERAGRTGRNPQTGEPITIPSSLVPAFKAGNKLKDAVRDGHKA